ncbi:portal protein [Rhizobium phage vB_RleM_P10VF]|uniref:Portal protein n=1 Tax=Rhizobium phage vB_RleM_P10VF TaxID=1527770 RepID=A0A076YLT9_9CAUD|nr:portal protein [Rhizobium phage vB_RleM_P10VF]AIK68300.1 putative portal vertex protein [Rhizobium phage vB_RleM_P10VF]
MKVFGFDLPFATKASSKNPNLKQLDVEPNGSAVASSALSRVVDFDFIARSEIELVNAYRRISYMTEVSTAIDEIVNEIVVSDDSEEVVKIDMSKVQDEKILSQKVIDIFEEEFKEVTRLLDFNSTAYNKVRDWYIDGKIIFQKVVDMSNPKRGVQKLVQLDPRKVRMITLVDEDPNGLLTISDEFFVYTSMIPEKDGQLSSSFSVQMSTADYMSIRRTNLLLRIEKDALVFVDSGMVDKTSGISYGYLHKAVRIANQLDLVETSLVIYRLARSSERRVIYVDPGNLPPTKAMERLESVKAEFRNKTYYDTVHGTVEDKSRVMSLQEDYFLLRQNGKSTEIDTLSSGENLGTIEDVEYFKEKLFISLNVPMSRFRDQQSIFSSGTQISRDELKFHRFVTRLRAQFTSVFIDILKTQLVLKKVMSADEFEEIREFLKFKFNKDNFFSEIRDIEELERRIQALETIKPYIGLYYSNDEVRKKVLGQTAEEIEQIDKQIQVERESGMYKDREISLPDETLDFDQPGLRRNREDVLSRSSE